MVPGHSLFLRQAIPVRKQLRPTKEQTVALARLESTYSLFYHIIAFGKLINAHPKFATAITTYPRNWILHIQSLLKYHVLSGNYTTDMLMDQNYTTLNGEDLTVTVETGGNITITDGVGENSTIVNPMNIIASNGVAHAVSDVLLPSWAGRNDFQYLTMAGNFQTFVGLLETYGLNQTLSDFGGSASMGGLYGFTVFAPDDNAFMGVDLSNYTESEIIGVLKYHIIPGVEASVNIKTGYFITTDGSRLTVDNTAQGITLGNGANVISADNLANNGIVHGINKVLIPQKSVTGAPTMSPSSAQNSVTKMLAAIAGAFISATVLI